MALTRLKDRGINSILDLSGKTVTYGLTDADISSLSTGKVLQTVSQTYTTRYYTSSTSYVDSGFNVNITPTSSSSKILIIGTSVAGISDSGYSIHIRLGGTASTNFYGTSTSNNEQQNTVSKRLTSTYGSDSVSLSFLDNPASTSQQTYTWRLKSSSSSVSVMLGGAWNNDVNVGNGITTITAIEIAG